MIAEDILALWRAHQTAALPEVPQESKGELLVLDEVVGGCVAHYLTAGYTLDPPRIVILEDCRADLERLLPDLEDSAAAYFGRLEILAGLLLAAHAAEGEQGT
jgi:hypothetical protein